ncbi:hypothetical protein [Streptomyces sp. NPDC002640]
MLSTDDCDQTVHLSVMAHVPAGENHEQVAQRLADALSESRPARAEVAVLPELQGYRVPAGEALMSVLVTCSQRTAGSWESAARETVSLLEAWLGQEYPGVSLVPAIRPLTPSVAHVVASLSRFVTQKSSLPTGR